MRLIVQLRRTADGRGVSRGRSDVIQAEKKNKLSIKGHKYDELDTYGALRSPTSAKEDVALEEVRLNIRSAAL